MFKSIARIVAASLLLAPMSALATPIRVDFSILSTSIPSPAGATTYNGYSVGSVGTGWFVFDDAVGSFVDYVSGYAPTDLTLDWAGVSFTEETARLFVLTFDDTGSLTAWGLGAFGSCPTLNCVGSPGADDFYAVAGPPSQGQAVIHAADSPGAMRGTVTSWSVTAVPEPATLGLLALGLLGMSAARRKRVF